MVTQESMGPQHVLQAKNMHNKTFMGITSYDLPAVTRHLSRIENFVHVTADHW